MGIFSLRVGKFCFNKILQANFSISGIANQANWSSSDVQVMKGAYEVDEP